MFTTLPFTWSETATHARSTKLRRTTRGALICNDTLRLTSIQNARRSSTRIAGRIVNLWSFQGRRNMCSECSNRNWREVRNPYKTDAAIDVTHRRNAGGNVRVLQEFQT